jgi:hypothetical protein
MIGCAALATQQAAEEVNNNDVAEAEALVDAVTEEHAITEDHPQVI